MSVDQMSILAEISEMLRAIRDDLDTGIAITMDSAFRADLAIESIDIVALAGRLQARYGDAVQFAQFVGALDLDAVSELRVGQLVEFIMSSLADKAVVR
jgi:acyl carrier protein